MSLLVAWGHGAYSSCTDISSRMACRCVLFTLLSACLTQLLCLVIFLTVICAPTRNSRFMSSTHALMHRYCRTHHRSTPTTMGNKVVSAADKQFLDVYDRWTFVWVHGEQFQSSLAPWEQNTWLVLTSALPFSQRHTPLKDWRNLNNTPSHYPPP